MLKKASKRLMTAIISLVVSVILCVGVCLAWFAVNNRVSGEGMNPQLRGDDIISFKVTPYYLNITSDASAAIETYAIAADGNKNAAGTVIEDGPGNPISVDKNNNGEINVTADTGTGDIMRPYSLGGLYTTAVLFKLEYEVASDTDKTFRIFAECPCPLPEAIPENKDPQEAITRLAVVNDGADAFKSNLSNAVTFAKADVNADNGYFATESYKPFVNNSHEKSFILPFYDGIDKTKLTANAEGNLEATSFVIMDYDSDRFAYLSALMLENGGSLSSKLNLLGDITFVMEEYDTNETVAVESIALDTLAPNAVYTQTAGTDVISDTWQFVVTYTDGSKKIVKKSVGHSELGIMDVDTSTVGEKTATVTYSGVEKPCSVAYTVTEAVNVPVTGVSLNKTSTSLAVGDTESLTATVAPAGATNKTVTWTSDSEGVATVENGVITAVAAGTATITVTTADGNKTATCEVTVTAQTTTNYTVTFNANGHGTAPTAQTVAEGGKVTKPADLTEKGWTFGDWYKEQACTTAFNFDSDTITKNTTLYAKWTATEYTITYILDGGINASDNPSSYTIETAAITLSTPTKTGFTFNGWYNGETKVETIAKGSTGDLTLTAKWTEEQTGGNVYEVSCGADEQTSNGTFTKTEANTGVEIAGIVNFKNRGAKRTINGKEYYGWQSQSKGVDIMTITASTTPVKVTVYFNGTNDSGVDQTAALNYAVGSNSATEVKSDGSVTSFTVTLNANEVLKLIDKSEHKPTIWLIVIEPIT